MANNDNLSVADNKVIAQTKEWIKTVVIGLNFCPFAKKVFDLDAINFYVDNKSNMEEQLQSVIESCQLLDSNDRIETSFMIYTAGLENFNDYLDLLDIANQLIIEQGYEGVYQLASFHPQYCFDGLEQNAAENYTNRSPYPMLHLLREQSLEQAIKQYKQPEKIPERNMDVAKQKGASFFIDNLNSIKN